MDTAESPRVDGASALERLTHVFAGGRVLVLTGAGVSTESGIPDYRDERGEWKHRRPVEYRDFLGSLAVRKRYWARSFVGFELLRAARPNAAHQALAALEERGKLELLVTQNVDGLHDAAGSRAVVDLHGRIDRVICLACAFVLPRAEMQAALERANPEFSGQATAMTPDGDAEVASPEGFHVVDCPRCGGVLKPDVVFFGEHVPAERVRRVETALLAARALVVVGSSLMVFSGYRFARKAAALGVPVYLVNRGVTRADGIAALKVEGSAGETLQRVATTLSA
ncbi:MAG TPA: NAD-dependent protein deacetylase [Polyangiaceae bacterium]|nr:NAD-dependent protein deacetylase [Polyangiaceae bacterium]